MRILSDKFIERVLNRIDEKKEKAERELPLLPDGVVNSVNYKPVVNVINNRGDLAYVNGFWCGYTIGQGSIPLSEMADKVADELEKRGFTAGAIEAKGLAEYLKKNNK